MESIFNFQSSKIYLASREIYKILVCGDTSFRSAVSTVPDDPFETENIIISHTLPRIVKQVQIQ